VVPESCRKHSRPAGFRKVVAASREVMRQRSVRPSREPPGDYAHRGHDDKSARTERPTSSLSSNWPCLPRRTYPLIATGVDELLLGRLLPLGRFFLACPPGCFRSGFLNGRLLSFRHDLASVGNDGAGDFVRASCGRWRPEARFARSPRWDWVVITTPLLPSTSS
jgi:hypothetical protein